MLLPSHYDEDRWRRVAAGCSSSSLVEFDFCAIRDVSLCAGENTARKSLVQLRTFQRVTNCMLFSSDILLSVVSSFPL